MNKLKKLFEALLFTAIYCLAFYIAYKELMAIPQSEEVITVLLVLSGIIFYEIIKYKLIKNQDEKTKSAS